eukprot:7416919-Pyramimonas_sp.AAC.2
MSSTPWPRSPRSIIAAPPPSPPTNHQSNDDARRRADDYSTNETRAITACANANTNAIMHCNR